MNIHEHCLLSQRKFGGLPGDYESVHAFMDSSKYFFYHIKHRMLLHHLLGVEWAVQLLGNTLVNADGKAVMVRDVAVEHCREDLDGRIPTLFDWLQDNAHLNEHFTAEPIDGLPENVQQFLLSPFLRTGMSASLLITYSDFGVHLTEQFFGLEMANVLAQKLPPKNKVKDFLGQFRFGAPWQYSPQRKELDWLRKFHAGELETINKSK